VDDFLRRSASSRSVTAGGYQPYYDPRLAVGSQVRQQASGKAMVNPYTPANLPQTNNTPFSLQPRPISSRTDDLSVVLKQQMQKRMQDDVSKITDDLNAMAKEARKSLDPELEKLKQEMQRDKPPSEQELNENRYLTIRDQILDELQKEQEKAEQSKSEDQEKAQSEVDSGRGDSQQTPPKVDGSGLLKEHKTFANLAQAKAGQYIDAGMQWIQQGKYYKAADSFAMAAIWQPDNGLVYAGQSWALFNAGEFMSSAYYLGRAIELNPKLAERKIALTMLTSDRDVYENRLLEVSEWQKRSNSGELAFLMAYFYWQDGKVSQAQESMQTALALLPQEPAVKILAGVIGVQAETQQTPVVQ
jgi:tetratricopeptide (TPR) repeat protein